MNFSRNLGLISKQQQEELEKSKILIAGVGGMGGVCAEVLTRLGVGALVLCDHDIFEEVNFNRQIHSNINTIGKFKVEVLKEKLLEINPNLNIRIDTKGIQLTNVEDLVKDVDIVINGMDQMFNSLILERKSRDYGKIIVDAWLTPFASVFVMSPDSPHWEEFLDLPTKNIALANIDESLCKKAVLKEVEFTFSHFNPFEIIDKSIVQEVISGNRPRPSLAPVVWLSGTLMANEAFKILTNQAYTNYAGIFYDQYEHRLIVGNVKSHIRKIA